MKLYDSELKVMQALWTRGALSAKRLAEILAEQAGWSKTTTYTVIKKCLDKGAIGREEPGFVCRALVTQKQAREEGAAEVVDKLFGGAPDLLVASLLDSRSLSEEEIERLKKLVNEL